jgi:hypothetical protein
MAAFFEVLAYLASDVMGYTCEMCGERCAIVNLTHFICRDCCEDCGYPIDNEEIW